MPEPLPWMGANPSLQRVLTLRVRIGSELIVGECSDGLRCNYPILGGDFEGLDLKGRVLGGGEDYFLLRPDGTGQLDARYSLATDQGEIINIHNVGMLTTTEHGRQLEQEGHWPVPETEYRCTCTPTFQVPNGRLAWLSRGSFIGRVYYPAADQVVICCYRFS